MRPLGFRLSLKLPLLVVLAVVLTAGAGSTAAIVLGRAVLRTEALNESNARLEIYASAVKFYLDQARAVLETTASRSLVGRVVLDRDLAATVLANTRVFEYVMLLKPDGTVNVLEPETLERQLPHRDHAFLPWYRSVVETRATVVSDLHISPATQRPTVVIATPVRSARREMIGIWAGALRLDELSRLGRGPAGNVDGAGYGYLTDRRGLIIAHQSRSSHVENQTDFSAVPTVRAALGGQRGTLEFVNPIDGEAQLGAYRPLEDLGWAAAYVVPTRVTFAPVDQMTSGIALASTALAAVMGGIGFLAAQRIVGPVKRLAAAARTIGTGEFGERIDVRTGDEIEQLADELNRMAAALGEKEAQLRRRAAELRAANKELEAFSYSVAHDLRAPLRAMDGFSRILLDEEAAALSPTGQRYLGFVRQNAQQMGRLVDDLLTFSRLSRQPLKRAPVACGELVKQALESLEVERAGRRVELVVGELGTCDGDRSLLKQVWVNLLSNGFKFTRRRDPARIELGCREGDGTRVYFVKDNGVGFDPRYADKLFRVFQRLHRAEEYEGTGIGLAIVQRIVHRHGGRAWAESEEGRGATFYFTLAPTANAVLEEAP